MALADDQKTLGGEPVVTLTIGSHTLGAFVWGYRYEEVAEAAGRLTIWLDNRGDEFDDLANDYADLKRGAAVDLRRGLASGTVKLPRTWIERLRYVYEDGAALLRLDCVGWRTRCERFRYAASQSWSNTEIATIVSSILGQVNLTLASGTFGVAIDFAVGVRQNARSAVDDLVTRVEEYLYSGLDGEIKHKQLDPAEAAGYTYGWHANHPLMAGTEVEESSLRFNKIVVNGSGAYTGSAEDSTESALVGTRLRTVSDLTLDSDAKCAERADAELRFWQAQKYSGVLVARPHFTLALYDVLAIAAPPWGGPATTGRVTGYVEEYGRGQSLWEQRITLGQLPVSGRGVRDATVSAAEVVEGSITAGEIAADTITAANIASGAVTADEISVSDLSAISADLGAITAGSITMGIGTKDADLDGFQIDEDELVGQENGVDQVVLSASDGKITAGAGAVVLDAGGIYTASGNADVNKLKVLDGADVIVGIYGEVEDGVGTSATVEAEGKQAADPEGLLELIAKTYDGQAHDGVASVTITLDTATGKITLGGATRLAVGTLNVELTEISDPGGPGTNRGRLYVRDNGSGKSQLCVVFNTGAVQVIATEP